MKRDKIVYWTVTGLLCALFLMGAMMYLFNFPRAESFYTSLGFPTWMIYPSAIAKILGVLILVSRKSVFLKELAYAGFLFDSLMAFSSHLIVSDGAYLLSLVALLLTIISWIYDRKVFGPYVQVGNPV